MLRYDFQNLFCAVPPGAEQARLAIHQVALLPSASGVGCSVWFALQNSLAVIEQHIWRCRCER